jgi:hypothetical protein
MSEYKVTPGWAGEKNGRELGRINREIYRDLCTKYRIAFNGCRPEDEGKYDVIITFLGVGYARHSYVVRKNAPNLSGNELALLCDDGNLCFGYSGGDGCGYYDIYTD